MNDWAIKVEGLSKTYRLYERRRDFIKDLLNPFGNYHREYRALENVSFEINRGETVGIIGKNGAGKSTLLKILTGVLNPTSGTVRVNGKVASLLELGAGFNPMMTGMENIYFNGAIMGYSDKEMDKRVDAIVEFADIGEYIHQPVRTYSSGMFARLAFSVAIHVDPDILIVDEALSVGDTAFQRKCFAKMEEIKSNNVTVIYVSHSEESIVGLCQRALWLHRGHVLADDISKVVTGLYMKYGTAKDPAMAMLAESSDSEDGYAATEYYDPEQLSQSMIVYDENGARISNIDITNVQGDVVNVLSYGQEYFLNYDVTLFRDSEDVNFGFLIKNVAGVELSGGSYSVAAHENRDMLTKGTRRVRWKFTCLLQEGEYFINVGVSAKIENVREHLHRILDAKKFKVISSKGQIFTGYFDLIKEVSYSEACPET